ncbi:ABC-type dipeptide transport system, periplasmic component [Gottschalkia purinilytica]|uniref:ABC-type dipeptide transport system, periplasmic component n=1 Tax=Gottschalkia purinilytica TaxID=1503 RepID=A0A0L0W8A7_GOTPU|nr:ABC transporter substrate-binding protein [Gottschalkia purinilytica]KNF07681.1 ABC-type dipeptide transport system, periplasmic component [Gottschalkia purinilytica]
MKRRLSIFLTVILVFSLFLAACSGKRQETKNPDKVSSGNPAKTRENADNTLVVGIKEAKGEFLPVYFSSTYDRHIVDLVYDRLVKEDNKGEIVPDIAKEWTISEDKKTYTFKLKDNVKFSDGKPLTAKDVEFTHLIAMDPNYDGRYITTVDVIEGYEEYNKDKEGKITSVSGIKVINENTISFTFKEPLVTNLVNLSDIPIMPKHEFPDYKKGKIDVIKAKMDKPLGSGKYILEKFEPKQYVKFKANPDHFAGKPKIENLVVKFTNAETMISELQKGTIDIQSQVAPTEENKELISQSKFLDISSYPGNSYGYLGFNLRDSRLSDKRVRQALVYGFNRKQFVENYYKEFADVMNVPMSKVSWAYTDDVNKYEYDKDKAIKLLEEAGWKLGKDGIREKDGKKLEFVWDTYTDSKYVETLIPMLKDDWQKIGVKIEPNIVEFSALTTKVYTERNFDMYNMAWSLTGDPDYYGTLHSSADIPDGNNSVGFRNAENDELIEKGRQEFDKEKRKEIYKDWAKLIGEELPYMFIDQSQQWEVYNKRVKNFKPEPFKKWTDTLLEIELEK